MFALSLLSCAFVFSLLLHFPLGVIPNLGLTPNLFPPVSSVPCLFSAVSLAHLFFSYQSQPRPWWFVLACPGLAHQWFVFASPDLLPFGLFPLVSVWTPLWFVPASPSLTPRGLFSPSPVWSPRGLFSTVPIWPRFSIATCYNSFSGNLRFHYIISCITELLVLFSGVYFIVSYC